jgi:hypothetical protein
MNLDDDDTVDELPAPPRNDIPAADRELLELAARALGAVRVEDIDGEEWVNLHFEDGSVVPGWNSLLFGEDTLDLSVRLRITIDQSWKTKVQVEWRDGYTPLTYHVDCTDADRKAATRRAVTRAAAEIGRKITG